MPVESDFVRGLIEGNKPYPFTSYSGTDFTFILHVPVALGNSSSAKRRKIQELEDEIKELLPNGVSDEKDPKASETTRATVQLLRQAINNLRTESRTVLPVRLTTLQTVSFQTHCDKQPVRALGHAYPKGYTSGARLIAGSMIFTVIREHPLAMIIDEFNEAEGWKETGFSDVLAGFGSTLMEGEVKASTAIPDQLPPLHLTILGVNEAGNAVTSTLYGIRFINDGTVISVNNMITEVTMSFVAEDVDIMRTLDTRGLLNISAMSRTKTVSNLLTMPYMQARRLRRGLPF